MLRWRYFCLIFLLTAVSLANPLDIRQYLKGILENQLSSLISKKVTIGQLRGNLYREMVIYDMAIRETDGSSAALIGRAEITYSLKNIILQKFDVLSNIKEIRLFDSQVLLKRDQRDKWNYSFAAQPENKDPAKKTPYPKMRISFVNSSLHYIDEKGFGQRLSRPYDQTAVLNGWLDVDGAQLDFSAEASLAKESLVKISGQTGQGYNINLQADNIKLAEHGWYALSFSDFALNTGMANISAAIQAATRNAVPRAEVVMQLQDTEFKPSDYLAQPLKNINGTLVWNGQRLRANNLRAKTQDAALTLNGLVVLADPPVLDIQAEISGVDFQKKYSRYFSVENLSGQGAAKLALKGQPDKLSGQGALFLEKMNYNGAELGDLTAEIFVSENQGEIFFNSPQQAGGAIAFWLEKDRLRAQANIHSELEFYQQRLTDLSGSFVWDGNRLITNDTLFSLNGKTLFLAADYSVSGDYSARLTDSLENPRIEIDMRGNARQNFTANIQRFALDLRENELWQDYFPDGGGLVDFQGDVFWRKKELSVSGRLQLEDIHYSDLKLDSFRGDILLDKQTIELLDYELELADSSLRGSAQVSLAEGEQPIWQRMTIRAGSTMNIELAAASRLANAALAVYQDLQKRAEFTGGQINPVSLPKLPLYAEYEESILNKFAELAPSETVTENPLLAAQGQLSGHIDFFSDKGEIRLDQDIVLTNGVWQGQRVEQARVKAHTESADITSVNITLAGLTIGGARYDQLIFDLLVRDGSFFVQDFNLLQGRRETKGLLSGKFPVYGLWDERYRQEKIDLQLRMSTEDLVLFTPFVKGLGAIKGDGNIALELTGTLQNPLLSASRLDLNDISLELDNNYFQEILLRRAELDLRDNQLYAKNLEIALRNYDQYTPLLNLSGSLQLQGWSLLKPEQLVLHTDLKLADAQGHLNIRNLYNGDVELRQIALAGDLLIPLSLEAKSSASKRIQENEPFGPLLSGSAGFANGVLYLFKLEKAPNVRSEKNLAIQLDLDLNVRNDVRVQSGDSLLLSGEFSSFFNQINIDLRDENPPVKISGSTNFLRMDGRIFLDEGYISFINRRFTLLDTREQERYFLSQPQHRPQENYLEFVVTERFKLEPQLVLVAQTTVYNTVQATASVSADINEEADEPAEPQLVTTESDYLAFIDGSIFDLSSISFEKYQKEDLGYALDGEPYVLRDPVSGRTIDQYRFQELTYDISPSFIKSAIAMARGTGAQTMNDATRETFRDLTITEINLLMRSLLKPAERAAAEWTGLYDVRFRRDFGQDAARLANLDTTTQQQAEEDEEEVALETETLFGLELVKELWRERLFFSLDTNIDRNLQTKHINITVNSYKLTWKILKNYFIDELSLNAGNELDILQEEYIPVLSLELLHSF